MLEAIALTLTIAAVLLAMWVVIAIGARVIHWIAKRSAETKAGGSDDDYARWRGE